MDKFCVEYDLRLDLGVKSGWARHDPTFLTEGKAQEFLDSLAVMDRETDYRVAKVVE